MTTTSNTAGTVSPRGASAQEGATVDPHAVTISGLVLDPSYSPAKMPESLKDIDSFVPEPGAYPYTRGLYP